MNNIKMADADALFSLAEESIKNGNDVKVKIAGFSMYPLVTSRRDSVLLTECKKIKKGDVPLIKREDGSFVLHRVVGIKNGSLKLRGDYEQKAEYPVNPEQIVAVAKGFYRKEKYIDCNSKLYKLYTFLWMNTVVIRPLILKLLGVGAKIKDKRKSKGHHQIRKCWF